MVDDFISTSGSYLLDSDCMVAAASEHGCQLLGNLGRYVVLERRDQCPSQVY